MFYILCETLMEFLRGNLSNPNFWSVTLAVGGIVLTVILYFQQNYKALCCQIISREPLPAGTAEQKLNFGTKQINQAGLLTIRIRNSGKKPIKTQDCSENPIVFNWEGDNEKLGSPVSASAITNKKSPIWVSIDESKKTINLKKPGEDEFNLDPDDYVVLRVLFDLKGDPENIYKIADKIRIKQVNIRDLYNKVTITNDEKSWPKLITELSILMLLLWPSSDGSQVLINTPDLSGLQLSGYRLHLSGSEGWGTLRSIFLIAIPLLIFIEVFVNIKRNLFKVNFWRDAWRRWLEIIEENF